MDTADGACGTKGNDVILTGTFTNRERKKYWKNNSCATAQKGLYLEDWLSFMVILVCCRVYRHPSFIAIALLFQFCEGKFDRKCYLFSGNQSPSVSLWVKLSEGRCLFLICITRPWIPELTNYCPVGVTGMASCSGWVHLYVAWYVLHLVSRPDVPNARASTTLTPLPRSTACSMGTWYSNSTLALLTMPVNQHQVLIVLGTKAVVIV